MNSLSRKLPTASLYLLALALFASLACKEMLTRGMFADGLVYTSIAINYAEDDVPFWQPRFTATVNGNPPPVRGVAQSDQPYYTQTTGETFYAHPPLMMYLLSLWVRLVGSGDVAVKGYSILVMLLTALLIVRLWNRLGFGFSTGWLPLLLWTLIPPVTHYAFYNMLEPTMLLFILASVLCLLREGRRLWLWHLLAGLFLFLSFLTKEFTGLFPSAFPAVLWVARLREHGFGRMLALTAAVFAGFLVPCLLLALCSPAAWDFFQHYLSIQILGQAMGSSATSRFAIVGHFFLHTGIVWGIVVLAAVIAVFRKRTDWLPLIRHRRKASAMFMLALCGVLPLMVSAKQSDYFLLTAFPFFALAAAILLEPFATRALKRPNAPAVASLAALVAVVAAVVLNAVFAGRPGRNVTIQEDMDLITPHLARGEVVTAPQQMFDSHFVLTLSGYYFIDRRVSLDSLNVHPHLVTTSSAGLGRFAHLSDASYRLVDLPTTEFQLYELTSE